MNINALKFTFFGCLTTLLSSLSACIKQDITVDVPLTMSSIDFTIPKAAANLTFIEKSSTNPDLDRLIKEKTGGAYGISNIRSLKIVSCELTLQNGSTENNFSALKNVKVEFSSNINPAYVTLAEITDNPDVIAQKLLVPVNQIDLKKDLSGNLFTVRLQGTARKTTTQDLRCTAVLKYTAEVGQ